MDAHAGKHFPRPTPVSRPYWDACREGRLLLQRCDSCGKHQFYPRILCSHCGGSTLAWAEASGRGTVTRPACAVMLDKSKDAAWTSSVADLSGLSSVRSAASRRQPTPSLDGTTSHEARDLDRGGGRDGGPALL